MSARKGPSNEPANRGKGTEKKQELSLDQKLIKALAHPLRMRILALMNDREWSPNELSEEVVEGLSQISYHVKVLRDFEMIEATKIEPRRGAVEHFYKAIRRAFIPSGMAKHIPKSAQSILGNDTLEEIDKDVAASLKSGRFYARDDWHASWTPVDLDGQGCEDAEKLCDEFVERFLQLEVDSDRRRDKGEGDGEHIATSAAVLAYGSEHGEIKKAASRKKAGPRKKPASRKKTAAGKKPVSRKKSAPRKKRG